MAFDILFIGIKKERVFIYLSYKLVRWKREKLMGQFVAEFCKKERERENSHWISLFIIERCVTKICSAN